MEKLIDFWSTNPLSVLVSITSDDYMITEEDFSYVKDVFKALKLKKNAHC